MPNASGGLRESSVCPHRAPGGEALSMPEGVLTVTKLAEYLKGLSLIKTSSGLESDLLL
jgi:hypothetical protein